MTINFATIIIIAFAPGLALLLFFYLRDRYELEPKLLTVGIFFIGALVVVPSGHLENYWHSKWLLTSLKGWEFFFWHVTSIGFVEEMFKAIPVIYLLFRSKHFNEPYDGILYMTASALGFASFENLFYVIRFDPTTQIAYIRMFLAIPMHALNGVIIGYHLGITKNVNSRFLVGLVGFLGILIASITHGVYNYLFQVYGSKAYLHCVILILILWIWAFALVRKSDNLSPFKKMNTFESIERSL